MSKLGGIMVVLVMGLACAAAPEGEAPSTQATEAKASTPVADPHGTVTEAKGVREDVELPAFKALHGHVPLIDVRTTPEYEAGHIPGAVHIPLDQLKADHPGLAELATGEPVYFVCASGGRSGRAADQMAAAGLHAVNVLGGTNGWKAAGHPVE